MAERKLKLKEMERAFQIIMEHYRENGIEEIPLEDDFYWVIDKDVRYDPYNKPQDIGLGQLYDDAEGIEKMVKENDGAIGYDLVCLSALLRYIGEKYF